MTSARLTHGATAFLAVVMVAAAMAGSSEGPGFDLSWHSIDNGGGISAGASFQVHATIGQHDATTAPMSGGTFTLVAGFWPAAGGVIPVCQGDPNGDGFVNIDDLLLVINNWGATGPNVADLNGSGAVNIDDLLIVINGWGMCP